jgi:hypothetical protein
MHDHLQFGIYRKPTATNILIHSNSCHPIEQNMSGVNYLINRLVTYPLSEHNKTVEIQTIQHMLKVNNYHYLNIHVKYNVYSDAIGPQSNRTVTIRKNGLSSPMLVGKQNL